MVALRVALLHNPTAGDEGHSGTELVSLISRAGHAVAYRSVDEPGWETALRADNDLVCAAGGDGTVARVVRAAADAARPVALLPLGSANNIAREFGLFRAEIEELVSGWETADRRRLELGHVVLPDRACTFVETVGGGLFGELLHEAEDAGPAEDKIEQGLTLLRKLVDEVPIEPWQITLDGEDRSGDYIGVEAMLIAETGPNVPLAPLADPGDRVVEVVLVTDDDRAQLAAHLDRRLSGRPATSLDLEVVRCSEAVLVPDRGCRMRLDDEPIAATSATVSVCDAGVDILSPGRG